MALKTALVLFLLVRTSVAASAPLPTKITFVALDDGDTQPKGSVKLSAPVVVETQAKVIPLVEGMMYPIKDGFSMVGSVTFIADQGYFVVVDSPSASDQVAKDQMFKSFNSLGVLPNQIHVAITTHGHPDHFGQGNFFSSAKHLFGPYVYSGGTFTRTELFNRNEIKLTRNIEIWNTPGHTNQDISVLVKNVADYGTVAVVGDLFYSEIDALSDNQDWQRDALDGRLGIENRRRVLCAADAIVPGHSKIFRVTSEMRARNGCGPRAVSIAESGVNDLESFRKDLQVGRQQEAPIIIPEAIQPTMISAPFSIQPNTSVISSPLSRAYASTLANPTIPLPTESQRTTLASSIPISLPARSRPVATYSGQQMIPVASQQPLLSVDAIQQLQQTVLLPLLESTATNLANYLTAAQGGVPIPQLASTQVRTTYPTLYPTQLQMLPQGRLTKTIRR